MDGKLLAGRIKRSKFFIVGGIGVFLILLLAFLSPFFVQFDGITSSLLERFTPPEGFSKGFSGHILGTDQLGRDILTRILLGARISLMVAVISVAASAFIGTVLGLIAGYFGGVADKIIMRACDVFLSIPSLILAIAVMAVLGTSIVNLVGVMVISRWVQYARLMRNQVMVIRNKEFVLASKAFGASHWHIMFKQIFVNITTPLIILLSQQIGQMILMESSLSFLNMGIQPPLPSWGSMIANGRSYIASYPWVVVAPGVALMITVLSFNFLGDGLRDVLDPKQK